MQGHRNKRVLVIGGMGFIGSNVVRALVNNGANVTIMNSFFADISKIKRLLNWEPKTSLLEGLKITHEFYKKFGKHYF